MFKKVEIQECCKLFYLTHMIKKRSTNTKYISQKVIKERIKFNSV